MITHDLNTFSSNSNFYGQLDLLITVKSFDLQAIRKRYLASKNNPNNKVGSFERRETTEGGVVLISIRNGEIVSQKILATMAEPRGVDTHGEMIALSSENKVYVITPDRTYTITNDWFSYIHTVKFNSTGDRLLVSSSGLDSLFEYYWETGELIREWHAWDHGLNVAKTSESGKLVLTRFEDEAAKLEAEGKECLLINNPLEQVLPTAKRAAFINSATYHSNEDHVLATLFHEGNVRKINLDTGAHEVIIDGMNCPHGGAVISGGVMATNTRGGAVKTLVNKEQNVFDFSNLPGKPDELKDAEWLQNTVDHENYFVTIDSNRNQLVIFDPETKQLDRINYDLNWAVQDLIPLDASKCPQEAITELSTSK